MLNLAGRKLPPLGAVRAFEAAARHSSFREAAEELHVTPSAISHQVRTLEDWFGTPLFRRLVRRVELTAEGEELVPSITEALDGIAAACQRLKRRHAEPTLTVSVAHTFASGWLIPHIGGMREMHPELDVRLMVNPTPFEPDFHHPDVDAAIVLGDGDWTALRADFIIAEELVVVCAPELAAPQGPLATPEDLREVTLLRVLPRSGQWRRWLERAGVSDIDTSHGLQFQSTPLAVEAALAGAGVAMANREFVNDHLETGRLVVPFDIDLPGDSGYYLIYPEERVDDPVIRTFREWLLSHFVEAVRETAPLV